MSRVIFGPGTCTRNSWMSPRPRSSSSITSLSFWSAGTSFWIEDTASSISTLVSAVDIRRAILAANAGSLGIEQRLCRHLPLDPLAEDLDGDGRARLGLLGGQQRVRDRAPDRVAVAARGHPPGDPAAGLHGLVAEGDRARVGQHQAAQAAG